MISINYATATIHITDYWKWNGNDVFDWVKQNQLENEFNRQFHSPYESVSVQLPDVLSTDFLSETQGLISVETHRLKENWRITT
jgi:hypothetical protein